MRFLSSSKSFCSLCLLVGAAQASKPSFPGPDYESLPVDTLFPGPWEASIRAPVNKSHITPSKVFAFEGNVAGGEAALSGAETEGGIAWVIGTGGLITFEFAENIGGRVCFEVDSLKDDPYLVLSYSESPFFAGRETDATDELAMDLPLKFRIKHKGQNCVAPGYNRGAFKYLTVFMPKKDVPAEEGFWHDGHEAPQRVKIVGPTWYETIGQKVLGWEPQSKNSTKEPAVTISKLWVNCTAFPSNPNGRAYTGYFESSSSMLNRVWYAGAYTLQLSTLDPKEGSALISYNRRFDHNDAPVGAWYSNFTIANGTAVTTDGAKRDRMVWPGDMTIAVPGIAVSTYDMLAVRNALDTIYEHQYGDGSMPYAGPPIGASGEFSDTYHLHTLIGSYFYVLYSGDLDWLKSRWSAYTKALEVSIAKVDEFNLLHVSSIFDWIRPGMTGHNVEASAILYEVLGNSIKLENWLGKSKDSKGKDETWEETRSRLRKGIATLYCSDDNLFSDNKGRRSCNGSEKVLPQDGNSWALLSHAADPSLALNVSSALRDRWIKYGAPATEFPNVISPFASSFELLAHAAADNHDAAVELIEFMWGYMLDGPGMTNSTLVEGYRVDGYIHYPAYPSPSRNSHAHGWAAGPTTVLMQGILGINLLTPLGQTWEIKPTLTKWLSHARGGFATKLGKFEVQLQRLKSLSTGKSYEGLNVTVPTGTEGDVKWGGESFYVPPRFDRVSSIELVKSSDSEEVIEVYMVADWSDFVPDDQWVKPEVEERPEGVVDWEALEQNYVLAEQRYMSAVQAPSAQEMVDEMENVRQDLR